jgi:carbamoyl-phosphate synthase large subunit
MGRIVVVHTGRFGPAASVEQVHTAYWMDPWFLDQIALLDSLAAVIRDAPELSPSLLRKAKRHGFSDVQIGAMRSMPEAVVRGVRHALGIRPVYKTVDTCAAEFAATTPYHYSCYDEESEVGPRTAPCGADPRLGAEPDRAGCRVRLLVRARQLCVARRGFRDGDGELQPETVSTDYDTSDRLYFEPLTLEDVLEVVHAEQRRRAGGGSCSSAGRPAGVAPPAAAGVPDRGHQPAAIHLAEDRGRVRRGAGRAGAARAPRHATASRGRAECGSEIGYPVLVRPRTCWASAA